MQNKMQSFTRSVLRRTKRLDASITMANTSQKSHCKDVKRQLLMIQASMNVEMLDAKRLKPRTAIAPHGTTVRNVWRRDGETTMEHGRLGKA